LNKRKIAPTGSADQHEGIDTGSTPNPTKRIPLPPIKREIKKTKTWTPKQVRKQPYIRIINFSNLVYFFPSLFSVLVSAAAGGSATVPWPGVGEGGAVRGQALHRQAVCCSLGAAQGVCTTGGSGDRTQVK
jgi:hypothetical protein